MNGTDFLSFEDMLNETYLKAIEERRIQLKMLLTRHAGATTAKNALNRMLEQETWYNNVILGLALYPVLSWSLYGEDIAEVIQLAGQVDDAPNLAHTSSILRETFGFDRQLTLKNRERYYSICHEIIGCIDEAVEKVFQYPKSGAQLKRSLQLVMDVTPASRGEISRFEINKYLPQAIRALDQIAHDDLTSLVSELLNFPSTIMPDEDSENLVVFHNVNALLREYSRLCWGDEDAQDRIGQILRCKTPQEIMAKTLNDNALYSADAVLKFLQLVTGAIALVEHYPVQGGKYADILKSLVSNRTVKAADGTSKYLKEQELAEIHNMSPSTFSQAKQHAFALLGLLLWGYDGKILDGIVEDEQSDTFL